MHIPTENPSKDLSNDFSADSEVTLRPYNELIEEKLESYSKDEPITAYLCEGDSLPNRMMKAMFYIKIWGAFKFECWRM